VLIAIRFTAIQFIGCHNVLLINLLLLLFAPACHWCCVKFIYLHNIRDFVIIFKHFKYQKIVKQNVKLRHVSTTGCASVWGDPSTILPHGENLSLQFG